jgi:hypothetical protein
VKTFKLLKIDLQNGVLWKWRYIVFAMVCLFCCCIFGIFKANIENEYGTLEVHTADCIAYLIHGSIPGIRMVVSSGKFELSTMWMALMMFEFLMPLDYPVKSMELWGYPYIIHTNRKIWWNAKCLYTLSIIGITELIKLITIIIYCRTSGIVLSMDNNVTFYEIIFGDARLNLSAPLTFCQNIMLLIVVPTLGVMAMGVVQLFISVWIHPIVAYLFSIIWLIASVLLINPLLLGNCIMPIRNVLIDVEGLSISSEVISCVAFIAAFWLLGLAVVRKKDIYVMKKEVWL